MNLTTLTAGLRVKNIGFFKSWRATVVRVDEVREVLAGRNKGRKFMMIEVQYDNNPNATHSFVIDEIEARDVAAI